MTEEVIRYIPIDEGLHRPPPDTSSVGSGLVAIKFRKADGSDIIISVLNLVGNAEVDQGQEGEFFQGTVDVKDDTGEEVDDCISISFTTAPVPDGGSLVEDNGDGDALVHLGGSGRIIVTDCSEDSVEDVTQINFSGAAEITGSVEGDDGNEVDVSVGMIVSDDEGNEGDFVSEIDFRGAVEIGIEGGDDCFGESADVLIGMDLEDDWASANVAKVNTITFGLMDFESGGIDIMSAYVDEDYATISLPVLRVSDDSSASVWPVLEISFSNAAGDAAVVSELAEGIVEVNLPGVAVQGNDSGAEFVEDASFLFFEGVDVFSYTIDGIITTGTGDGEADIQIPIITEDTLTEWLSDGAGYDVITSIVYSFAADGGLDDIIAAWIDANSTDCSA